jgi:hypothetical protein
VTTDQIHELVEAVDAFLAELDALDEPTSIYARGSRGASGCGECPPSVDVEERLRAAMTALSQPETP